MQRVTFLYFWYALKRGMFTRINHKQENKSQSVANSIAKTQNGHVSTLNLVDNSPKGNVQRKLQEIANENTQKNQSSYQLKSIKGNSSFDQLDSEIVQLNGKDEPEDKKKGDDYCNNVGKSLSNIDSILHGFLDGAIRGIIATINSNRSKCAVTSSLVKGTDTNTEEYGKFNESLMAIVGSIQELIDETNREYFNKTASPLVASLIRLFDLIPAIAVDPRVAVVVRAGLEGDPSAIEVINAALILLRDALKKRIIEYIRSIGPYKKAPDKDPEDPDDGGGGAAMGGGSLVKA
ncbi:MAG: hypothetical protein HWD80_00795 [Flavobacteriaceae bacterium]|nr:hypothetical protein [Flavobacteriaceae bacterium]